VEIMVRAIQMITFIQNESNQHKPSQTETPAFIQNKWAEPLGVKWSRSELEQEYQTILCGNRKLAGKDGVQKYGGKMNRTMNMIK
jgi:hypothetical protein